MKSRWICSICCPMHRVYVLPLSKLLCGTNVVQCLFALNADVAQGLAVCELGGTLTGGLLLLLLGPVAAALAAAALHLAAWLGGAALLRRFRYPCCLREYAM